jgi:hypothetical protein
MTNRQTPWGGIFMTRGSLDAFLGAILCTAAAGAFVFLAATPVWAHHAFAAEFDLNDPVTLRGTVTQMEWVNPHAWIHLDVKSPDGKVASWMVEGGSPNILLRRGFTKQSLVPGTEIVVEGFHAKNGENLANGANITFKDGRRLFLGSSAGTSTPYTKGEK